ncbi:uncharacterized protein LOC111034005 [Myzus persicae]|uniref:uncharacterized protein LOC111034005 n=1 Tax=Myzus persicae TaxID=13164 RepID=UPI000B9342CE|nr:uncharacterized protein LOC111034005 [Myzus persicae]
MSSPQESPLKKPKLQIECPSVPTIRTKNDLTISLAEPYTRNYKSAAAVLVTVRNEVDVNSKKSTKIKTVRLFVSNKPQNNCKDIHSTSMKCKDIHSTSKHFSRPTPYGKN